MCGSCWAFSATGGLEGLYFVTKGELKDFSEQNLVDCSKRKDGNQGCNGGLMDLSFDWVKENGIATEADYPYKGRDQTCASFTPAFKISGYTDVPKSNPEQLKAAVA